MVLSHSSKKSVNQDLNQWKKDTQIFGTGVITEARVFSKKLCPTLSSIRAMQKTRPSFGHEWVRELPFMTSALRGEGVLGKSNEVSNLSKGGCVNLRTGGGQKIRKFCRHHKWKAPNCSDLATRQKRRTNFRPSVGSNQPTPPLRYSRAGGGRMGYSKLRIIRQSFCKTVF